MESENLVPLTEAQWQEAEKLGDLLVSTTDLPEAIRIGLEDLLKSQGCSGGALYLPRFCEHVTEDWTVINTPQSWVPGLSGSRAPLYHLATQVMETGQAFEGIDAINLAGVFPVLLGQKHYGALLAAGPVIPPAAYPAWQALLRPFARLAAAHAAASGNTRGIPGYLELMRSRNTLRAMFDSLPISIYIIDSGYNMAAVNLSRSGRAGVKPNQLVGRKCYEILYGRSELCPGCRVSETFGAGLITNRINRIWLDNDKFVEWEISTFPIFDEKDQVMQTIIIEQDVTDKRNLEANLIQSEKLAAVGQLAAGVAHEINNPLTAIIANAQLLRHEVPQDNSDLIDSVKLIEMAGTRASQVVRNLLGIARKEKYEFEPIDLNETLHNALTLVQHELVGHPILLRLNLAEDMPRVVASRDQLQGVWINLILNAIDAIDKDPGEISINACYMENQFQITISDNGKGIAQDHLPRVFEPFFTTKSVGRGTGLGLSLCMRVIRHHGGNIHVESQVGKWTRFVVSLPGPK